MLGVFSEHLVVIIWSWISFSQINLQWNHEKPFLPLLQNLQLVAHRIVEELLL